MSDLEYLNPFGEGYVPGTIWWDGLNQRQKMFNETILRGLDLLRATEHERRLIAAMINELHNELVAALAKAEIYSGAVRPSPTGGYPLKRLGVLGNIVEELIRTGYTSVGQRLDDTLQVVAIDESNWVKEALHASTHEDFLAVGVSEDDLRNLATNLMIAGSHARDWWDQHSFDTQERFMREVRNGALRGESIAEIARRIRGQPTGRREGYKLKDGSQRYNVEFVGGVLNIKTHQAETLVRTALQTVSAQVRRDMFFANRDVIRGLEQVSTLDSRTTVICRGYDGGRWDLDGEPIDGTVLPFKGGVPRHWNCRSAEIPLTKSWEELGIEGIGETRGVPEGMARASATGLFGADTLGLFPKTFDTWIRSLPPRIQDAILGRRVGKAYRSGRIKSVRDLLDQVTGEPLPLWQLEERDLLAGTIAMERRGRKRAEALARALGKPTHEGRFNPDYLGPLPFGYDKTYGSYETVEELYEALLEAKEDQDYQDISYQLNNAMKELDETNILIQDGEMERLDLLGDMPVRLTQFANEQVQADKAFREAKLDHSRIASTLNAISALDRVLGGIPAEGFFIPPGSWEEEGIEELLKKFTEAGIGQDLASRYIERLSREWGNAVILPADLRQWTLKLFAAKAVRATAEAQVESVREILQAIDEEMSTLIGEFDKKMVALHVRNVKAEYEIEKLRFARALWFAPIIGGLTPGIAGINYGFADHVTDHERAAVDLTMAALADLIGSRSHFDQEWNEHESYWHILREDLLDHGYETPLMQGAEHSLWQTPDGEMIRIEDLDDQGGVIWTRFTDRDEWGSSSHRGYGRHHWLNIMRGQTEPGTIAHEMGHSFESSNSDVMEYVLSYFEYRSGNQWGFPTNYEGPTKLIYRRMDFFEEYAGVIYGHDPTLPEATEFISKGFEFMLKNPIQFFESDPEYFEVIADILSGNFRTRGTDYWGQFEFKGRGKERESKAEPGFHDNLTAAEKYAAEHNFPIIGKNSLSQARDYVQGLYEWAVWQRASWPDGPNPMDKIEYGRVIEKMTRLKSPGDFKATRDRWEDHIETAAGAADQGKWYTTIGPGWDDPETAGYRISDLEMLTAQNAINMVFSDDRLTKYLPSTLQRGTHFGKTSDRFDILYPIHLLSSFGLETDKEIASESPFSDQAKAQVIGSSVFIFKDKFWKGVEELVGDSPFGSIGRNLSTMKSLPDTLRHELGHVLYGNFLSFYDKEKVGKLFREFVVDPIPGESYSYEDTTAEAKKFLSYWAGMNTDEFFAEAFAMLTNPLYPEYAKRSDAHPRLVDLLERLDQLLLDGWSTVAAAKKERIRRSWE